MEKRLALGVAQHLSRLILALRDGLDAAAVDFSEVGGVVENEGDDARRELEARARLDVEDVVGHEVHREHLQHERGAAHDGDIELRQKRQRLELAQAREGHRDTQRYGTYNRQGKYGHAHAETLDKQVEHR